MPVTHPYRELIQAEVSRAEADLNAFRARSLAVITTSSGILTLMTGLIAFGASKAEKALGLPDAAIWVLVASFILLAAAAGWGLSCNWSADVDRPSGAGLQARTTAERWPTADAYGAAEREVAEVLAAYLVSVRQVADTAATRLNIAIALQLSGLVAAAVAGFITVTSLN